MVEEVKKALRARINPEKAAFFPHFFKTGPGEYGEGDKFLGVTVPDQRKLAKQFKGLSLNELEVLLNSPWHEERLTALIILVNQFKKADQQTQQKIYDFYLAHTDRINNWDLVDTSARDIVGGYLYNHQEQLPVLLKLAAVNSLWERRIAILATYYFLIKGQPENTVMVATRLLQDKEDLIHKAVGWMLREMGKRCGRQHLLDFLDALAHEMPRTMLRYSIEHLDQKSRNYYLSL